MYPWRLDRHFLSDDCPQQKSDTSENKGGNASFLSYSQLIMWIQLQSLKASKPRQLCKPPVYSVCIKVCTCTSTESCMWKSEDNFGVVSFRLYMGFRDQIQVVRLTWQTAVSAAPSHCLLFVILVAVLCFIQSFLVHLFFVRQGLQTQFSCLSFQSAGIAGVFCQA